MAIDFDRFTDPAIKVLMLAQEENRRLGHNFVGTEQILLGLIGEGTGVAARVLKAEGINLKDARIEVEKIIGRGSGGVAVEIPFTTRAKLLLELSLEEARELKHTYIGTEHLLLGLIREGGGVAARILEIFRVDLTELRSRTLEYMGVPNNLAHPSLKQSVSASFVDYICRQALTLGRQNTFSEDLTTNREKSNRPSQVIEALRANLSEGEGHCLGVLEVGIRKKGDLPSATICNDGTSIVSGNSEGQVCRWSLLTGQRIWSGKPPHEEDVPALAISPDGNFVISGSKDQTLSLWDLNNGEFIRQFQGQGIGVVRVCWSPDGSRVISSGQFLSDNREHNAIVLWDVKTASIVKVLGEPHSGHVCGLQWMSNGTQIFSADTDGRSFLWDASTGELIKELNSPGTINWCSRVLPNGRSLLLSYLDGTVLLFDPLEERVLRRYEGHSDGVSALDISADGRYFATGGRGDDKKIRIWNTQTGAEVAQFHFPESTCWHLAWSPNNDFIVSAHTENILRFWDLWAVLPEYRQSESTYTISKTSAPIPLELRHLPNALTQLHRLGIFPPLSLVQHLLTLTSGESTGTELDALPEAVSSELSAVIQLRWSTAARLGIVALLLQGYPSTEWVPPAEHTLTEVRDALEFVLSGDPVAPDAPALPIIFLRSSLQRLDKKMLSLLRLLGPEAIEQNPGLVIQLRHKVGDLPILSTKQQSLIGLRVDFSGKEGAATGYATGSGRREVGGMEMGRRNEWNTLLPSQFALPRKLFAYKFSRGELLYRTRRMADPPQQRPVVLLLDVSPPVQSTVEQITRPAAFAVMQSLQKSGVPIYLVTTGEGEELVMPLRNIQEGIEIWTKRTWQIANVTKSLETAEQVRNNLWDGNGVEPITLLLTHPWLGAETDVIPRMRGLRGLFVQYPGQNVEPALAKYCDRWESLKSGETENLEAVLGYLFGGEVRTTRQTLVQIPDYRPRIDPEKLRKLSISQYENDQSGLQP